MNFKVREIRSEAEFEGLSGLWTDLLAKASDACIFLSHDWLYSWWCAYRPAAQLRILLLEQDGVVVGIAPMMVVREWRAGMPVRALRFIGDGTWETDHMSFVVREDRRQEAVAALLEAIDGLNWDLAHFNQMPDASPTTLQTLDYARRQGWLIDTVRTPTPVCRLPGSYEELLRLLPSRFRTSIRSSRRRLEESGTVQFGLHERIDELDEALGALFANHASRWQAKGQSGVFVDARKRTFYDDLSRRLLARGALRFFFLRLDGRIIAQQYCFQHGDTVMLLQEGFDYEFAKLNVGNVLRAMVFEHLIAEQVAAYDFLAGVSRHKQNWANLMPDDVRIECCRRSLRGRAAYHGPRVGERIKRAGRALLARVRPAAAVSAGPDAS